MNDPKRLSSYLPDLLLPTFLVGLLCLVLASEAGAQNQQSPAVASPYTVNCERPKDHNEADLCELRRQAKAAEDSVWWTRTGFYAVVVSLLFTGWAAFAAARAATAADKSVRIASCN